MKLTKDNVIEYLSSQLENGIYVDRLITNNWIGFAEKDELTDNDFSTLMGFITQNGVVVKNDKGEYETAGDDPGPVIPTDRILYTVVAGGHKPESTWITENCSENVFDESTGEGYLLLNEGVTTLEGRYIEEPEDIEYTIFKDYQEDWEDYNITSIVIPTQITIIGEMCFENYNNLKSVTIPNSVTSIGDYSFSGCSGLSKIACNAIDPPELGEEVFSDIETRHCIVPEGCEDAYLNSDWTTYFDSFGPPMNIEIKYTATAKISSEWITEICSDNVFDATTGKGTLHATTNVIRRNAFRGCITLTSITIPESIIHIGNSAFYGCDNMTKVYYNAINCEIESNTHEPLFNGDITEIILGNNVEIIPSGLYIHFNSLTSITIPNSVREIESGAFYYCLGLTSITIPNSVREIEMGAFSNCTNLTSVNFYAENCALDGTPFKNCSSLETINFGNITRIPENICYDLSTIKYISIPNSVVEIGQCAFYECSNVIGNVIIPDSVNNIGEDAFFNITNIIYHGTATGSPWGANNINKWYENKMLFNDERKETLLKYYDKDYQDTVIIPNSVTSIGEGAFMGCELTSVAIPDSVTSIGPMAFSNCPGLTSITIGNSVETIDGAAFFSCSGLTSISIPDSVKVIGSQAFQNCSGLTSLTIGTDVESIDAWAFYDCKNLTEVTCLATNPPTLSVYNFNASNDTLYVPAESVDAYQNNTPWRDVFTTITAIQE